MRCGLCGGAAIDKEFWRAASNGQKRTVPALWWWGSEDEGQEVSSCNVAAIKIREEIPLCWCLCRGPGLKQKTSTGRRLTSSKFRLDRITSRLKLFK